MKFSREDYESRIVDNEGLIPDEEPVFLLRGQDKFAPFVLFYYAALVSESNPEMSKLCYMQAANMISWQYKNGNKVPDLDYQRQPAKKDTLSATVNVENEKIKNNFSY